MGMQCATDNGRINDSQPNTPIKVLVVDDDTNVIDGIKRRLKPFNIEIIEGFHGVHGIWRTITERPDVIITDICMPLVNGEEVVRCLRNNQTTNGSPIIVLTGLDETVWKKKMLDIGVDAFFTKPVDSEELLHAITSLVASELNDGA